MSISDVLPARIEITALKAGDGDCLLIRCLGPSKFTFLIDGGRVSAVTNLKGYLQTLPEEERGIDLFVLTHIDADHIAGALTIARDGELNALIEEVWFNDSRHLREASSTSQSTDQGDLFSVLIEGRGWLWNRHFDFGPVVRGPITEGGPIEMVAGIELHLLGPSRDALVRLAKDWPAAEVAALEVGAEDTAEHTAMGQPAAPNVVSLSRTPYQPDQSATNGSSIAFLLSYAGLRILVSADSHAEALEHSIVADFGNGPFEVNLATLPHHGGPKNTSPALAGLIDARQWLVSTTGRSRHPHGASIARVLMGRDRSDVTVFNFNSRHDETWQWDYKHLKDQYGYRTKYAESEDRWITVALNSS